MHDTLRFKHLRNEFTSTSFNSSALGLTPSVELAMFVCFFARDDTRMRKLYLIQLNV